MGHSISEISPRHRFEARIDIHLQRGEHKLNVQGWVRDLSESGLRAFVADPLVPGELVVCEVPLSNISKQVSLRGIKARYLLGRGRSRLANSGRCCSASAANRAGARAATATATRATAAARTAAAPSSTSSAGETSSLTATPTGAASRPALASATRLAAAARGGEIQHRSVLGGR